MKIIAQAVSASFLIHIIYIFGTLLLGFIQTLIYRPNIETAWRQLDNLQSQVVFGASFSPYIVLLSFVTIAFFCWFILLFIQKKSSRIAGE
ncbi:hypothetical protein ABE021_03440 [Sporosarcina gallistercoris]|uniref:hypothetical protein n=1 Tax=Sporosarcina gallistercoris TaxID=2762245 RepID=UPI003D2CA155